MTETWLTSAAKDELFIKGLKIGGYDLFSVPRKGNGGYGGVAILYKKNLSVLSKTSCEFSSFEHCEVTVKTGSKQLNVNVVYRPPPSQKNRLTNKMFFDEFSPFMHDRIPSTGQFLLLGDLNFHLEDRNDTEALKLNDLFQARPLRRCGLWLKLWQCAALLNILWMEKALYKFQLLLLLLSVTSTCLYSLVNCRQLTSSFYHWGDVNNVNDNSNTSITTSFDDNTNNNDNLKCDYDMHSHSVSLAI